MTKYQQGGGAKCPRDETTRESIKEIISVYLVRKEKDSWLGGRRRDGNSFLRIGRVTMSMEPSLSLFFFF